MYAFVPGIVLEKHEDILLLGNICSFYNFSVKNYRNDEKFRCIQSDKKIILTNYTEVKIINEDQMLIQNNMFNFYDQSELDKIASDNVYLTGMFTFFTLVY